MSANSTSFLSQTLVSPSSVQVWSRSFSSQILVNPSSVQVWSRSFIVQVLTTVPPAQRIVQRKFNGVFKRLEPGYPMTSIVFPTLAGLTFDIIKRPRFSTKADKSVGGQSTRTPFFPYPVWEYELAYDYLPDSSIDSANSLQTLMNFFLARQGGYDTFLFQDPDAYQVTDGPIGTGDGTTTTFTLSRLAGLKEPIGQVNFTDHYTLTSAMTSGVTINVPSPQNTFTIGDGPFYIRADVTTTLPAPLRQDTPYWVWTPGAANPQTIKFAPTHADALAGTNLIDLQSTGDGTYYLYQPNLTVKVAGSTVTNYHMQQPNQIVFDTAPTAGQAITATFNYYMLCRFQDDTADFNKFADKLWELQKITFETVPSANA